MNDPVNRITKTSRAESSLTVEIIFSTIASDIYIYFPRSSAVFIARSFYLYVALPQLLQ